MIIIIGLTNVVINVDGSKEKDGDVCFTLLHTFLYICDDNNDDDTDNDDDDDNDGDDDDNDTGSDNDNICDDNNDDDTDNDDDDDNDGDASLFSLIRCSSIILH